MNPALYAGFLVFALVSSITPGPNNLMVMASGARFGLKRSLPHMAGICLGFGGMTLAVGLGLAGIFQALPWLYVILRWSAAAYLLYLAWHMATATSMGEAGAGAQPMRFLAAVAFQWVNPKAWVMALGAVTTYAEPTHLLRDVVLIAGSFALINIPSSFTWMSFGLGIKRFLKQEWALRTFNGVMAALLVVSLYPLITEPIGPAAKPSPGSVAGAPRTAR